MTKFPEETNPPPGHRWYAKYAPAGSLRGGILKRLHEPICEMSAHFITTIYTIILIEIVSLFLRLLGLAEKEFLQTNMTVDEFFLQLDLVLLTLILIAGVISSVIRIYHHDN